MDYYDWLHDSLIGWLQPYLSLFIDPHWMAASIPLMWIIVYSVMDATPIPHIYHVSEISVVFLYPGFPTAVFSVGHVLVKHFTLLSLSSLML